MRSILAMVAVVFAAAGTAHAEERMFFSCSGSTGAMAIQLSTESYSAGVATGFEIERRGLFDTYSDQYVKTTAAFAKVSYKPNNPKYKGLEKYVIDTRKDETMVQPIYDWKTGKALDSADFSTYELLVPPRTELEKIWRSPSDKEPNGNFDAYVQVRFSNGDSFVVIPLRCGLNWRG